ncbi:MAG: hypothetical protein ACLR5H_02460 [Oscillospiraceae bacterium]
MGKLIYGNTWYYAAAVTQEEAQRIAGCGSVSLRLTKGITDDIAATVHSVSPAEDGRCVVVLACREYLAETTQLRHQTAQIVLHSYTGLRLPSVCLRQQEDGTLGFTAPRAASPGSSRWTWCTREMTMCWCRCPRTPTDWTPCVPGTRSS